MATMKSYLEHDVTEVVLDYGQPVNAFDVPDGRRAFQWRIHFKDAIPTSNTPEGTATRLGNMAWINTNAPIYGGQPIAGACIYTLIGSWNEPAHSWTIRELRKPDLICR